MRTSCSATRSGRLEVTAATWRSSAVPRRPLTFQESNRMGAYDREQTRSQTLARCRFARVALAAAVLIGLSDVPQGGSAQLRSERTAVLMRERSPGRVPWSRAVRYHAR